MTAERRESPSLEVIQSVSQTLERNRSVREELIYHFAIQEIAFTIQVVNERIGIQVAISSGLPNAL
jgi:hypothetical protein